MDVFIGPVCDYAVAPIARQVTLDGREGGRERERVGGRGRERERQREAGERER